MPTPKRYDIVIKGGEDASDIVFSSSDPCEVRDYMSARNLVELAAELFEEVTGRCEAKSSTPKPPPPEPQPAEPPPEPEAVDGPPDEPDDGDQQGAPTSEPEAELSTQGVPTMSEDIEGMDPPDVLFSQNDPVPPEQVAQLAMPSASEEEIWPQLERWLRNMPEEGRPDPSRSEEQTRNPLTVGDPVDLFTGELSVTAIDLEVPTPFLPLRLVRTYRSGRPYFGPWGYSWDHNYNVYLRELADGGVARWTGRQHEDRFRWTGQGFEPERCVHERLERMPNQPHAYVLTVPGGTSFLFEHPVSWTEPQRIPLVEIRDRHGNAQQLHYDAQNRLERVADDAGRTLLFEYGDCGLLERVSDHSGRQVEYHHHAEIEHLSCVVAPATDDYPEGVRTAYEYDQRADHPAMRHNLLRVVDADGMTTLETDYGGPEQGWDFNRVVRQRSGGWIHDYACEQIQYVPPEAAFVDYPALRVTVRPPDGSTHTHTLNYRGDLIDYRFRLVADGSYRVVAHQWRYDEQGNIVSETRPDGGRTLSTFDATNPDPCARGNLLAVELVAPLPYSLPSRLVLQASYEPVYQLPVSHVEENQATTRFVYDFDLAPGPNATGRLARIEWPDATLPDGTTQTSVTTVETNDAGQVTALVTPEGNRTEIDYEPPGSPLAGFVRAETGDVAGVAAHREYAYDPAGFLARFVDELGFVTDLDVDAHGRVVTQSLPEVDGVSDLVRFRYDTRGQVREIDRPRGEYVDATIQDPWIRDRYRTNPLGHLVTSVVGANTATPRVVGLCPDFAGRAVEQQDADGVVTRRGYDERGRLLRETRAVGTAVETETRYVYDRVGRLVRRVDPGERETTIGYDPWGRPTSTVQPNGTEHRTTWGPRNVVTGMSVVGDPGDGGAPRLLSRTEWQHDEKGRVVRSITASFADDPGQAVGLPLVQTYDGEDRLVRTEDHRGAVTTLSYDKLGSQVRVEDAVGNAVVTTYDPAGRVTEVRSDDVEDGAVRSRARSFSYDSRGRLVQVTEPTGAVVTTRYDSRDLGVEVVGATSVVTRHRYGLLGETTRTVVDPGGLDLVHECEHDLAGRPVLVRDPTGTEVTIVRDPLGRPIEVTPAPGAAPWRYEYTVAGEPRVMELPGGGAVTSTFDAAGRLVGVDALPGPGQQSVPSLQYGYDGLDRLVSAGAANAPSVTRAYDALGRLRHEVDAGVSFACAYDDLAGTRTLVHPDGSEQEETLDLLGRVSRVRFLSSPGPLGPPVGDLVELDYAGPARPAEVRHANGVASRWRYDDEGRVLRIDHVDGADARLESARYRYDVGNRRRLDQLLGPPDATVAHRFDARDRLIGSRAGLGLAELADADTQAAQDADLAAAAGAPAESTTSYVLDAADTRSSVTETANGATTTTAYSADAEHRVTMVGAEVVGYSDDGNRVHDAPRTYDVDALGRCVAVRDAATAEVLAQLHYDPLGRLSGGERAGVGFRRRFFGSTWLVEEDTTAAPTRRRVLHPALLIPIAEATTAGLHHLHGDGHHDLLLATDATGAPTERYRYAPFGQPVVLDGAGQAERPASALGLDPLFGGMAFWSGTGLYVTPGRLYDPRHGLFTSRDPEPWTGPSPYVFAHHDPVNFADPGGDLAPLVIFGIVALASATIGLIASGGERGFFSRGGGTALTGVGTAALGIALALGPVGWLGATAAALMIAGGVAGGSIGVVQLGASYGGATTAEQDAEITHATGTMMGLSSPGGMAGGVTGLLVTGGTERGLQIGTTMGNLAEFAGPTLKGTVPMIRREIKFGWFRTGWKDPAQVQRTWYGYIHNGRRYWFQAPHEPTHGSLLASQIREAYGLPPQALRRPDPNLPRGYEEMQLSHSIPERWLDEHNLEVLGNRPWNETPLWQIEHARIDPYAARFLGKPIADAAKAQRPLGISEHLQFAAPWMVDTAHGVAQGGALWMRRNWMGAPSGPHPEHLPDLMLGQSPKP